MYKSPKKNIDFAIKIFSIYIAIIALIFAYIFYNIFFRCGFNDGPFHAKKTNAIIILDSAKHYKLSPKDELILVNRSHSLSPILMLKENEIIKWKLDFDLQNSGECENCSITKIDNIKITNNDNPIVIQFAAHWTFGAEGGTMKIDRENGDNTFCVSW